MSDKRKLYQTQREARQEKQAKNVIKWIIITLLILGLAYAAYSIYLYS